MLGCFDVAKYFLAQIDEEAGDLISNLKLQKLVYKRLCKSIALGSFSLESKVCGQIAKPQFHACLDVPACLAACAVCCLI